MYNVHDVNFNFIQFFILQYKQHLHRVIYRLTHSVSVQPRVVLKISHSFVSELVQVNPDNSSCVIPTSCVVYQPMNHRNLWSIA